MSSASDARTPRASVVALIIGLAVVCNALTFVLFSELIAEAGPVRATVITYINTAACSSLAATFTASPVASRSSVPATTSPVLTPTRPSIPSSGNASCISTAARQARSASSSCAAGTPNTAITASPMNFSTVPPWNSTIPFMRSKYRASKPRSASGSTDSPNAVEPVTSQNSTVTVFRTPARAVAVSGAAQAPQKRKPSGFSCPQDGQTVITTSLGRHRRDTIKRDVASHRGGVVSAAFAGSFC
jgi:hypothetical protein